MAIPVNQISINKNDFKFIGLNLHRPECVITTKDSSIWVSDSRGDVTKINPDGSQMQFGFKIINKEKEVEGDDLPNGLCFINSNTLLIANLGKNCLEKINLSTGEKTVMLDCIDWKKLGKVNYVLQDSKGRIYLTISTTKEKWIQSINRNTPDGYIALIEDNRVRIVADGLKFPNEIRFDKREEFLYLAETCAQSIKRMRIDWLGLLKS